MQPQLQDQFLGSLWGAVIGTAWYQFNQVNPSAQGLSPIQIWQQPNWHQTLSQARQPLVHSLEQLGNQLGSTDLQLEPLPLTNLGLSPEPAEILLATLPLGFYYHDRLEHLATHLTPALQMWHQSELQTLALSLNGAIALILQGKTPIRQLVAQLGRTFNLPELPSLLSLLPTITTPSLAAFGFGFNCFLATPDQFWLALQQAGKAAASSAGPIASLVAGSLAGAYCGHWGIPIVAPSTSYSTLFCLANQLFADWCGVDPSLAQAGMGLPMTAPGMMRPR